jgi:hypothetical protein
MAIRGNGGYNSPELAQVAGNIAQMFGPPSGSELAAYSTARKNNQQSNIVAQLAADPNYQGFDHQSILADLYDPTQSFLRVNMDDATTRRGQDVSAQTAITTNANTNRTGLISDMFGPLNEGQVRPALPGDIAGMYGIPELPQVAGLPKPLSQDQVLAGQTQRLIGGGQITDDMLTSLAMGSTPVENVLGPDGKPVVTYRTDAVGQEPYFNAGAEAKPTNGTGLLPDGTQVPAVQGPDGKWRHAQTGQELPPNARVFAMSQATGTAEEIGMVSKPTGSQIEQQIIDITVAKQTAGALRDLIAESPSSQGMVGWMRGTAQNVIQTGGELGGFFGGGVAEAMADIENGLADASLAGAFDPNIPAIDMLSNLLAFQYAKTTTGERLSNEMLNASRRALGLDGLDANQANSLARLDQAIQQIEAQENILRQARQGGVDSLGASAPRPPGPPQAPAAITPETGPEVWDFDENGQLVRMQ